MKHISVKNVLFLIAAATCLLFFALSSGVIKVYSADLTIADSFEGYTKYEAEEAQITRADIEKSYGTFSGKGFVAQIDYGNSCIAFEIDCAEDGEYNMMVAYAMGKGFADASFRIYNDAGYYTQVTCSKELGWGAFSRDAVAYCTISLKKGENTVSVRKGSSFAQLDFIAIGERVGDYVDKTVGSLGFPVPEGYTRYEAEEGFVINATACGRKFYIDYGSGYSGGGFVGALDSTSQYVDIPVTVEESGTYNINLRYATESEDGASWKVYVGRYGIDGYLYYYAKTVMPVVSTFGTFVESAVTNVDIALEAGESFVRIVPDYNSAELDYIEIGPKKGEYYVGVVEKVTSGGSSEFGDDFFAEEKEDGYVKGKGCSSAVALSYPALSLVLLIAVSLIFWRNKNEKNN